MYEYYEVHKFRISGSKYDLLNKEVIQALNSLQFTHLKYFRIIKKVFCKNNFASVPKFIT